MQVRLLKTYAGPLGAGSAGEILDLPDDQAIALLEGGYAAPIGAAAAARRETASKAADDLRIPDFLRRPKV